MQPAQSTAHMDLHTCMHVTLSSQRRGPQQSAVTPLAAHACTAAHSVTGWQSPSCTWHLGRAAGHRHADRQAGSASGAWCRGVLTCTSQGGRLGSTCMLGSSGPGSRATSYTRRPQVLYAGRPQGAAGAHAMGSSSSIGSANSRASSALPSSRNRKVAWKQPASSQAIQ
jgi:hypothetical protein